MPDELTDRVIGCIAETQHLEVEKVTVESTFEELGIDSLDGMNILFAVEEEFDVNVPDEEAQKLRTVKEMVDGVRKLLSEKELGEATADADTAA